MLLDQDRLDGELRQLFSESTSIADGGFTDRVLRALPPRSPRRSIRLAVLVGMAATGCLLAMVVLPGGEAMQHLAARIPNAGWLASLPLPSLLAFYLIACLAISAALEDHAAELP